MPHREADYYKSILDNLTGGLVSVDLEGKIVYINSTAGRILHLADASTAIGKPYAGALAGFPALCGIIEETLKTRNTVHRAEISVMHGDNPMVIGYSTLQVKNPAGECLGVGIIFQHLAFTPRK